MTLILVHFTCRLWHQLTKKLFEFFDVPAARPFRVDVFERFVRDFESKINQLRLAEMGVKVARDIDSMCLPFSSLVLVNLIYYLFCRSSNPPDIPHIPRLTHRHQIIERGPRVAPRLDRACEAAVW